MCQAKYPKKIEGLWAIDSNEEDDDYLVECIPAMAVTKTAL